jgi:hypothetical protein
MLRSMTALLLLLPLTAQAAEPPANRRDFVACPIVRDTETVPCYLSEYEGELYYLGIQTDVSSDFDPPYLGHKTLVEGTVSEEPRICGGIVLKDLKISVMPELDPSCNTILPEEDQYKVPFAPRPPGPSKGRLAFRGAGVGGIPQAEAKPKAETRVFSIYYDVDHPVMGRHVADLTNIVNFADAISARNVHVTAYRGAMLLSDGTTLTEKEDTPERRAREVADLIAKGGLGHPDIKVNWKTEPEAADGVDDWKSRRVDVIVIP